MKRIDENHSFNINVACIVGERKAIILKEQYGWCLKNLHNEKNIHFGHAWTYNSAKAYAQKFPYWSDKSIGRWLRELEDDGWIASANLNKLSFDKTKWYTINFRRYDLAVTGCEMKSEDVAQWVAQFDPTIAQNEQSVAQKDSIGCSKREHLTAQNEQPIPSLTTSYPSREPEGAVAERQNTGPTVGLDYFAPDKHEQAARHLIGKLAMPENARYLSGMANGDWRRAVRGYCLKLQRNEKWYDLQIPPAEEAHYRWMSKMIAGIKSWYLAAAEIDRQSGRTPDAVAIKAPTSATPKTPTIRASAVEARRIAGI